jgi:hypothetical protein
MADCSRQPMSAFYWNLRQEPIRFGDSANEAGYYVPTNPYPLTPNPFSSSFRKNGIVSLRCAASDASSS